MTALFGRGDSTAGGPIPREFEPNDIPVFGTLFKRGGATPSNPVSVEKLYDAYSLALQRQASTKNKETQEEKQARAALTDAIHAIQAIGAVRSMTSERAKREQLTTLQATLAAEAVAAVKAGTIAEKRGEFKSAAIEHEAQKRELMPSQ